MITSYTPTIILCGLLLALGIATPFVSVFFRKLRLSDQPEERSADNDAAEGESAQQPEAQLPPLSVVIYAHDSARELERHLPAILTQDYAPGFEVIVVEGKSEDDTDDVLKQLKHKYGHLYTTFVPPSARYMSHNKLAITLGVKAAKNEWVLLTEPSCHPASTQWLQTMARNCQDGTDMVMGYANYEDEASDYKHFERFFFQRYTLREAQRRTAYRSEPGNLMFRKTMFIEGRSFEGNMKYIRGEYDFIVNKFAQKGNTATETFPTAWMTADDPTRKDWVNHHLFYMETRQHLKRTLRHRFPLLADQLFLHLCPLLSVAALAGGTAWALTLGKGDIRPWCVAAAGAVALVFAVAMRTFFAKKATRPFSLHIPAWKLVPYEWSLAWRFLYYKMKYRRADKYDFISHKL